MFVRLVTLVVVFLVLMSGCKATEKSSDANVRGSETIPSDESSLVGDSIDNEYADDESDYWEDSSDEGLEEDLYGEDYTEEAEVEEVPTEFEEEMGIPEEEFMDLINTPDCPEGQMPLRNGCWDGPTIIDPSGFD